MDDLLNAFASGCGKGTNHHGFQSRASPANPRHESPESQPDLNKWMLSKAAETGNEEAAKLVEENC